MNSIGPRNDSALDPRKGFAAEMDGSLGTQPREGSRDIHGIAPKIEAELALAHDAGDHGADVDADPQPPPRRVLGGDAQHRERAAHARHHQIVEGLQKAIADALDLLQAVRAHQALIRALRRAALGAWQRPRQNLDLVGERLSGARKVGFGSQAAIVVATSDFSFLNQLRSSTNLAVAVVPGHHS